MKRYSKKGVYKEVGLSCKIWKISNHLGVVILLYNLYIISDHVFILFVKWFFFFDKHVNTGKTPRRS